MILFGNNLLESVDVWKNGGTFDVDVTYNYGSPLVIPGKPMRLISGNTIFFEEYFIREVLQKMQQENGINFKFN